MEDCEESFDSGEKGGSSVAWGRRHVEADESIIGDDQTGNEHNSRIPAMRRAAETNGQLTRLRHHKKKAMQQNMEQRYRHKESPSRFEPELRVKSMRSKITRKKHRGLVPNRYFNGDFERPSEMIGSATVCSLRSKKIASADYSISILKHYFD